MFSADNGDRLYSAILSKISGGLRMFLKKQ